LHGAIILESTALQTNDATLGARIDNALKDLEIASACALKADQQGWMRSAQL